MVAIPLFRRGWSWPELAAFGAGAVLIDVDHYLGYVWETGDFDIRNAYAFHRRDYHQPRRWVFRPHMPAMGFQRMRFFHSVPILVAATLVAWRMEPNARPLVLGMLLHSVQDELWGMLS